MSLLKEAVTDLKPSKGGIKVTRLEENTVTVGITKYMDAVAAKYVKKITAGADDVWDEMSPEEQDAEGSYKEYKAKMAMEDEFLDQEIERIAKAFKAAVKRNVK